MRLLRRSYCIGFFGTYLIVYKDSHRTDEMLPLSSLVPPLSPALYRRYLPGGSRSESPESGGSSPCKKSGSREQSPLAKQHQGINIPSTASGAAESSSISREMSSELDLIWGFSAPSETVESENFANFEYFNEMKPEKPTGSMADPGGNIPSSLIEFGDSREWSPKIEAAGPSATGPLANLGLSDLLDIFDATIAPKPGGKLKFRAHQSSSCSTAGSVSDCDYFSIQGGESEEDMADVVKKSSEVVSSSSSSSSKKISSRQESHEKREVVKQSSVTSSSMVKQEQQMQSQQQTSSSSTSGSVVMSSTSSIQMKQKQMSTEMSSQMSVSSGSGVSSGQAQITSSSSKQQQQILMSQVNGQTQQQVSSSSVSQKSVQQLQSPQQQLQLADSPLNASNYIEEENENEDDLKVIGVTNDRVESEADLYFSNMIKKDKILNSENYCLSDDVSVVVDNLVDLGSINDGLSESNDGEIDNDERRADVIVPKLNVHPDLISDLEPPNLVPCLNLHDHSSSASSHDAFSNSSGKSSEGDSMGTMDIEELDKSSRPGSNIDENRDAASPSQGGIEDLGQRRQDLSEDEEDDEEDDTFDGEISHVRKKKKKVKKTESFSVIELLDEKMRDLANKYQVGTTTTTTNSYNGLPICELRACEKRVFENVSVANLRRSFCDLTSQDQPEEEFSYHLVERPKSSFSKFEGGAGGNNNRSSNQEEQQERANGNNKNAGTRTCKGCGEKVFVMEMVKAEKSSWHKNCFRCSECKKALNVDTYESNGGLLYCKPHFKELFQPKAVFESPEDTIAKRLKKRPELIIRENQPEELPPDVVRASIQPATADLEELSFDVKSKFELFEHFKETENKEKQREPVIVKRSTSVLAKLAKYEGGMEGQVGIPDSELNGGAPEVISEDEEDDGIPRGRAPEEFNYKLDDVKNKWETGMNSKKEEIHKHRQEEMNKFRTRLCLGKNSQLKEMYEKAVESSETEVKKTSDLDELDLKGKRNIKEMFEKGLVSRGMDDDEEEGEDNRASAIDLDRDVFEHGVAKTSRNLFQTLDKQVSVNNGPVSPLPGGPKKIAFKSPSGIIGVNDQSRGIDGEVVRSTDIVPEEIRAEDVGNKFRFFESYQQQQERAKQEKRTFRITPPREGQVKLDSPEREVYRDPNVVRSTTDTEQVVVGRTASKMLSVFKRLEETATTGTDEVDQKTIRRPLKQFTPPRETRVEPKDSDEEEEEESEYESEEEEQYENGHCANVNNVEDQFLKEVGSLARAKNLRAKFEKWEIEENSRNERENGKVSYQQEGELIGEGSIESTKSIRARFEQPQQFEQPKIQKREVQVKRFVELQNSNGLNMEDCVICNKRVYVMEKTEAMGKIYHKNCFRCSQCKCVLRMGNFTQNQGTLYCTPHFKQLFKIKGNYDEGFGYETGKQIWMKKQQAKQAAESGGESKEN